MNNNDFADLSKPDADILMEFQSIDREIARQLLSYRRPASLGLRRRVMAVTRNSQTKPAAWTLRHAMVVMLIGLLILVLPLALPQVRASVAQVLLLLRGQGFTDINSSGTLSTITLSPAPLFMVRQPGSLPDGFERTGVYYRSHIQTFIFEQGTAIRANLSSRLEAYESDLPHALFIYQASDDQYFLLFQRAALDNESLPEGRSLTIDGQPARLQTEGNIVMLTWFADKALITLETNTSESSLVDTANGLILTQRPETNPAVSQAADLALCDSENLMSQRYLLGRLDDQAFYGSVWIFLYQDEASSSTVAYGIDSADVTKESLLQRGLDTLRDPSLASQTLNAQPDVVSEVSSDQCLKPDDNLAGYVVIEVWEKHVNAAFVGAASDLRDRAISALEEELGK